MLTIQFGVRPCPCLKHMVKTKCVPPDICCEWDRLLRYIFGLVSIERGSYPLHCYVRSSSSVLIMLEIRYLYIDETVARTQLFRKQREKVTRS